MKNLGIKYQLRIITLIPVLLAASLFAFSYNKQFNNALRQHLTHLGEAYIHQLLPMAQLAILRDDKRTLHELVDTSTINPEVEALAFYDAEGYLLAYRGSKRSLNKTIDPSKLNSEQIATKQLSASVTNFVIPITLPKFNLYSSTLFEIPRSPMVFQPDEILGWLSIDLDTRSMLVQRYQMYIMTIFITLLGLLLSFSFHHFLSRRIYLPIARLRRSMKQILSNEFETQIKVSSAGELGIIERGFAHLRQQYLNTIKDLNQHVEVATTDLQQSLELLEEKNIELSLDKKKTEEKSRQKSELIVNMSHEIRTPMNGIIGFTNVLLDSKLDSLQLDYVKTIKSSAQDLLATINDILDYSKMDAGKLHLDCIPLDIRVCIDEVLALIAPMAHKKGIDLIPATAIDVPKTMLGDPLRIKQMISNLVSNAVKFTEQGYVLVRTSLEQETDKDYTLCLSVTDTGIGISPENQTTLFTAFNQGDTSITRRYGGSGLGLAICKKLAEHMQGRITLKSDLHKGSTFTIEMKLEKLAAYEVEKHQTHRFANLNVICFDDNPLHLEALCNGLGYWGIHCLRVEAFAQLEEAFNQHPDYHLAFVNVNQGCEQQVAAILHKQTMPCVLISKWPIHDYEMLGAQGFLFKPPNIQKLHETVDALVNHGTFTKPEHSELDDLRVQLYCAKPKLLVAEDNAVNRMLLHSLLDEKASIITVENGKKAVALSNKKRFDIILLDLQMPDLNGIEAATLIHQESLLNKTTPIILISANHGDLNKELLTNAGIILCLQKPIDEKILLSNLLHIINETKEAAINWPLCIQKVSGNEALAKEFLFHLTEELRKNRQEFIRFMQANNLKELERVAHKLHGACCFSGVPLLQQCVARLENLARTVKHTRELKTAFDKLIQSIDGVLKEYENSYRDVIAT